MQIRFDGNFELGANAVRGCHQHRIVVSRSLGVEQTAESAEPAKHAGTFGRPREGSDTFDKIGAGLYIDA